MPRASVAQRRQSEHTMSFSEDGVTAANAHGSQRFEWSHWRRWTRTGDLYLLRGARGVFTFVPARAFGSRRAPRASSASLLARAQRRAPEPRRGRRARRPATLDR